MSEDQEKFMEDEETVLELETADADEANQATDSLEEVSEETSEEMTEEVLETASTDEGDVESVDLTMAEVGESEEQGQLLLVEESSEGAEEEAIAEVSNEAGAEAGETELQAAEEQSEGQNEELEELPIEEEEEEFIPLEQLESILESLLFVSDKPLGMGAIKQVFKGTSISTRQIKKALDTLAVEFASAHRGVTLEEVNGGYRLHTKVDNMDYLKRMTKNRPFRLSGPALEVMAILAYKQPIVKAEVDEIRGVESGHLVRALMDKGLVNFAGKSELPGKPMMYGTTRKFLEIFGLKSLKDLPTLSEIDELLPEGIGDEEEAKPTLDMLTDSLSEEAGQNYSEGEEELLKISDKLSEINTSSEFFEQEKQRQRDKRDADRARDLREAMDVGEEVSTRDKNWLERYTLAQAELAQSETAVENTTEESVIEENVTEEVSDERVSLEDDNLEAADGESLETPEDLEVAVDPDDEMGKKRVDEAIAAFESDDSEGIVVVDQVEGESESDEVRSPSHEESPEEPNS